MTATCLQWCCGLDAEVGSDAVYRSRVDGCYVPAICPLLDGSVTVALCPSVRHVAVDAPSFTEWRNKTCKKLGLCR